MEKMDDNIRVYCEKWCQQWAQILPFHLFGLWLYLLICYPITIGCVFCKLKSSFVFLMINTLAPKTIACVFFLSLYFL